MKKNLWLVALIVVAIIAIGGYFYPSVTERVTERIEQVVGAVSTLDGVDFPFVSINGNREYHYSQALNATSSVICSIKNPFNATSTLESYNISVTGQGAFQAAQLVDLATSTTQYGSSSPAFVRAATVNLFDTSISWQPRSATNTFYGVADTQAVANTLFFGQLERTSPFILGPSEYLNVRIATSSPASMSSYFTGACNGVIRKI